MADQLLAQVRSRVPSDEARGPGRLSMGGYGALEIALEDETVSRIYGRIE